MFRRLLEAAGGRVRVTIDGKPVEVHAGDSVAAAMLAAGLDHCRTTAVSGAMRAPYCMMGVCFDCLAEIDGVPNRQSCMVPARTGMRIRRRRGARAIDPNNAPDDSPSFPIPEPRSGGA